MASGDQVDAGWPATDGVPETPAIAYDPGETPEWEPHVAARDAGDEATLPDTSVEEEALPSTPGGVSTPSDAPSEDVWSEPTPSALSDAATFEQASHAGQEDAAGEPEQETGAEESFSSFLEDEPFATSPEASPTPTPVEEDSLATPAPAVSEAAGDDAEQRSLEEVSAGVAADESTPEEEPFERAGRWWFKRGSELLVYNEQTGEWVPSPTPLPQVEPARSAFGPDASPTQTISDISTAEPAAAPEPQPEPEPQVEAEPAHQLGFWRCPACGAVNGSTAATCRMCFAERPAG